MAVAGHRSGFVSIAQNGSVAVDVSGIAVGDLMVVTFHKWDQTDQPAASGWSNVLTSVSGSTSADFQTSMEKAYASTDGSSVSFTGCHTSSAGNAYVAWDLFWWDGNSPYVRYVDDTFVAGTNTNNATPSTLSFPSNTAPVSLWDVVATCFSFGDSGMTMNIATAETDAPQTENDSHTHSAAPIFYRAALLSGLGDAGVQPSITAANVSASSLNNLYGRRYQVGSTQQSGNWSIGII